MSFNPGKIPFIVVSGMGDGLGGVSKPSKTPTEMAVRSTVTNGGEKDGTNQMQASNMETVETEEQITPESQNNSIVFNEVISSNHNLSTCHIDTADFDVQIQEINIALGKYDNCESYVAPNLTDTSLNSANNAAMIVPSQPVHILIT